ncbi:uncharacterized protein C05D11.1-like, partial [Atheta coriaria]|uniref:uncharacterized protein C05D11.1-like n=1 Tax=Dalotia coriaria TaxID=877792 RepID=UPI0031F36D82
MPPTDSTPGIKSASGFEHLYSLKAYNKIPLHEYKSTKTGLTVIVAEVEGPIVNGYFCLVTEALDDDGLPHTLEHLVFLGSEEYPYKGVLDLLANRCLASGTNAWTDVDHTCYTMETAGSEGFLTLLPIYLDHILYPILTDEGFVTEVHHVTGEGEDAGVVYCEMQGRENSAESRMHLTMARKIYPGECGYSSETGGIMKNLRESCSNTKVRNYHKEFYRPENLKLIITGQIKPEEVFQALEKLEDKILAKGPRGEFIRPWQKPVPPFKTAEDLVVKYPSDEENNGMFGVAWRGPPAVGDQYALSAVGILMKYLSDLSISSLQKEFIEIPEPYASRVSYSIQENAESCVYFFFHNVPANKLALVKPKLDQVLKQIADDEDIHMEQMKNVINRHIQESLSSVEVNPHHTVAFMVIGHMLYGNTKEDLEQRVNPIVDLKKMLDEPKSFWVSLLKQYFVDNIQLAIQGVPSIQEQASMASDEKARIEQQIKDLGEEGLKKKDEMLEKAIAYNERPPPDSMLQSVPIPSVKSISFHSIERFSSKSEDKSRIDLSKTPVFTYFDHIKSNFVYMFALLDTSKLNAEQRMFLPILLETIQESAIRRGETVIPRDQVIAQMNVDLVSWTATIGLGGGNASSFKVGPHSQTATLTVQVECAKYAKGIAWLREFLYETVFDVEVLKIMANKMANNIAQLKRNGRSMVAYAMKAMIYNKDSNIQANGILSQHAFLTKLLEQLDSDESKSVIETFESIRKIITSPDNVVLYCAGNVDLVNGAAELLDDFLPKSLNELQTQKPLHVTPDYSLLLENLATDSPANCIIGMGCLESSFFYQATPSIKDFNDPDYPALMLYLQYLIQCEGPLWKQVRGKGLSYGYTMSLKPNEGLLYLVFIKSTNVVGAYKESQDIVTQQLQEKKWDANLFESAKSSLIFELIDNEKTIGS